MQRIESVFAALADRVKALETQQIYVAFGALIAAYLVAAAVKRWRSNFPPGPWGWPIVGYLPHLSQDTHLDFIKLGKKYGDVFSVKLGAESVVVVHGVEAIKEALGKTEFLGRPPDGALKILLKGNVHKWKEQRRFVVHAMKDLGLGKTIIEGEIVNEINHFLEVLSSHQGKPVDLHAPLSPSVSNNICTLVFGKRYEYEDRDRIYLDKELDTATGNFSHTAVVGFFPWLLRVPFIGKLLPIEKALTAINNTRAFLMKEINKHKDTFDSKHIRDFIDSFIFEMESRKKKDPNTTLTADALVCNVLDLYTAGSETVRHAIIWCAYTAASFPDAQKRMHQEILQVMGPDRDPEYQDIKSTPFTHSFMQEVMRWKTIVPLSVPRYSIADTTLGGYSIPKNTTVITNLWNAHHSPDHWTKPDSFVPDRFIGKDGKTVSKPSHYMPFSMGKRVCPGEAMATMELFLYFTSILRKFELVLPDGYKPTFKATMKAVYSLDPHKIRFISRNE